MDFTYPLYLAYSGGLYRKPNIDEKVKISRSEKLHFSDSLHYIKLVKESSEKMKILIQVEGTFGVHF